VQHALGIVAGGMHGAVNGEAGRVHGKRRRFDLVPVEIDFHQARRGDLVEQHPIGVDEKLVLGPGHPDRDVGEDEVRPPELGYEAVAGGQIHAHGPFLGRDDFFQRRNAEIVLGVHRGSLT